ncbi:MAG: PQQ-binding-like beta-propeller repeat protein [Vicinamibacterales bacterium]
MISRRTILALLFAGGAPVSLLSAAPHRQAGRSPRTESPLFPIVLVWELALDSAPATRAAWDESTVYVALRSNRLQAISLGNGRRLWDVELATASAPVSGGSLVFACTSGNVLRALSASGGKTAWEHTLPASLSAPLHLHGPHLFAGTSDGGVHLFSAADGMLIWSQRYGSPLVARPALDDERAYLPLEGGLIVAAALATGARTWEQRLGGRPADVAAVGDRLYVGSDDNDFSCLSKVNGRIEWHWSAAGDVVGAAVADERRVYFAALDHVLRAVDRRSGVQRWRASLPSRPGSGPIAFGRLLLVSGVGPAIGAFNRDDGSPAGAVTAPGDLAGPPHIVPGLTEADSTLYVLTRDGRLAAFRSARAHFGRLPPALAPGLAKKR